MDIKTFLQKALGDDGYYCVFAVSPHREFPVQKFYPSIDQLIDTAENLQDEGFNVWFALSTFHNADSRKAVNSKQLRSFFLDLDCGPTKQYPDKQTAQKALKKFCTKLSLPLPQLVDSGNGIHAYWMLSEPVGPASWTPVAERLKYMCAEHGLYADPTVTADTARVLRMPGSVNYKFKPSSPVFLVGNSFPESVDFDRFSDLIGGPMISAPRLIPTAKVGSAINDVLAGNVSKSMKEILRKTCIGKGCTQLEHIIQRQNDCSEPLWRAGLSIVKFCEDGGLKGAHKMSSKHIEYDAAETERKYDLIPAPQLCATFDAERPNVCRKCPNWNKIKSPITLGIQIAEATEEDNTIELFNPKRPTAPPSTYVIPPYPRPYFRGANGGIYMRVADDDGEVEEKVIYHNDLYVVRRIRDVELGECLVMRLHLPMDGVQEFTVPLTSIGAKEEFRKAMAMQGVAMTKIDPLMQYVLTWVNDLQGTIMAANAHRQFGWTSEDSESFVLGDKEYFADHVEENPAATPTKDMFKFFDKKGTLDDWRDTVNFYNRPGLELHQFVTGVGFGSPLMQFMPISCAGMHLFSKDSGVGKTTAMFSAMSIWGNPDKLVLHKEDTQNGRMNRGEVYHNIPLCMDELTNAEGKELSDLAYQLTGGRQKIRMTSGSNTERAQGENWRMLAVSTGNTSFVSRISTIKSGPKAEAQRILECRVHRIEFDTKAETDAFAAALNSNYGHAGPIYIQYVMRNISQVKLLLADIQQRVDKAALLTAENRFWSVYVTTVIAGLILAKRCGLIDFDVDKVFRWAVELLKSNKKQVGDMGMEPSEILNNYISQNYGQVLWIKSTAKKADPINGNGLDMLVVPDASPHNKLIARYETDTKQLFLLPSPFDKWCAQHQIDYNDVVKDLIKSMKGERKKKRMGTGTKFDMPPVNTICLQCDLEIDEG